MLQWQEVNERKWPLRLATCNGFGRAYVCLVGEGVVCVGGGWCMCECNAQNRIGQWKGKNIEEFHFGSCQEVESCHVMSTRATLYLTHLTSTLTHTGRRIKQTLHRGKACQGCVRVRCLTSTQTGCAHTLGHTGRRTHYFVRRRAAAHQTL